VQEGQRVLEECWDSVISSLLYTKLARVLDLYYSIVAQLTLSRLLRIASEGAKSKSYFEQIISIEISRPKLWRQ
jgi:hypothetical protein